MEEFLKRTWVDIDLDAARHNFDLIKAKTGKAAVMCIVKADAYGHGVEQIALEYQRMGAEWFGVSNIEEAMELRRYGIVRDILILGYTPPKDTAMLCAHNITQAIFSEEYAQKLSEAAQRAGAVLKGHIKVDTGMGRIGFNCRADEKIADQVDACDRVCKLPALSIDGIFTHFAVADGGEDGKAFTLAQFEHFMALINGLGERGIELRWRHCCNSAGTLEYPEMHLDMVRPGIILYGLNPSEELDGKYDLRPVMQLRSVVSMVKKLEKGATVSYGRTYTAERDMLVATVPIGYADGYARALSGKQEMIVRGKRVPIIGRVCMDQLMLDVTSVPDVREGDTVTAFGTDGGSCIHIDELAEKLGTINYELVCRVARRVPRVYHSRGRVITKTDYLLW